MWQPSCSRDAMKARAECYALIRAFFMARDVLEVDTPSLNQAGATDPYLVSIQVGSVGPSRYLQTSPEFAMKRLLANGSGSIYQLCKCFRKDEIGHRHNPEFTMLEWYRVGFDLPELMDEISELVSQLTGRSKAETISYKQAFLEHLGVNPFDIEIAKLKLLTKERCGYVGEDLQRDRYLDLLLSHVIEPKLGQQAPCFLIDYPSSQASLAKTYIDADGDCVARRAELYIDGLEVANAYDELTDAPEQARRFDDDNSERARLGLPKVPVDENLLRALNHGLPGCAGVALGIDRILMVLLGTKELRDVMTFVYSDA